MINSQKNLTNNIVANIVLLGKCINLPYKDLELAKNIAISLDKFESINLPREDKNLINTVITNYNSISKEVNLSRRCMLFIKLLEDSEKLAIIEYLSTSKEKISDEELIKVFNYIDTFNYTITLNIIAKYKYYEKIYSNLTNLEKFKPYLEKVNNYLKERID